MKKMGLILSIAIVVILVGCGSAETRGVESKGAAPSGQKTTVESKGAAPSDQKTTVESVTVTEGDYPWWRGPNHNDIAPAGTEAPLQWGEDRNIRWKTPIPGAGHGTPILIGDKIFLPTAEVETDGQVTVSILALDRKTGEILAKKALKTGSKQKMHPDNSYASATIASDGQRLFYPYVLNDHLYLDCETLSLEPVWSNDLGEYKSSFGFCSSPVLYDDAVLLCADRSNEPSCLVAFERETGKERWKMDRSAKDSSNATPALVHSSGRDQLVVNGPKVSVSYDPKTGQELWRIGGPADNCCPSTPGWDERTIYLAGGWPQRVLLAVPTDGSAKEPTWTNRRPMSPYVPSILCQGGLLYCLTDEQGIYSLNASDGAMIWSDKLRGKFYSSPVLVGDRLYFFDRAGVGYVYRAGKTMAKLAENRLGVGVCATPVFADGGIYLRSYDTLYFIAEEGK